MAIREIFERHKGRYGYRRVTQALRIEGRTVNHKTVQRLMVEQQLRSKVRIKKFRAFSGAGSVVAPTLLQRDATAAEASRRSPHCRPYLCPDAMPSTSKGFLVLSRLAAPRLPLSII